ncbi:MAG: tRNA 2-thiocytidine biosynthesis TtcA family protein, partial [Clostridia bacterium]|nr:tRNA 2-thiocytidine biosynthesis TtcA family protein [Clostridia bacterium]
PLRDFCRKLEVPYIVKETEIGPIVFEERKEPNPCSLCARMRRGALINTCVENNINKLALGHHRDDALETLLMSVLHEGRLHTFQPATTLEKSGVTQIRPMIYCPEKKLIHLAKALEVPVTKSPGPVNGQTDRAEMKRLLDELTKRYPKAREQLLSALKNEEQYGLWYRPKE